MYHRFMNQYFRKIEPKKIPVAGTILTNFWVWKFLDLGTVSSETRTWILQSLAFAPTDFPMDDQLYSAHRSQQFWTGNYTPGPIEKSLYWSLRPWRKEAVLLETHATSVFLLRQLARASKGITGGNMHYELTLLLQTSACTFQWDWSVNQANLQLLRYFAYKLLLVKKTSYLLKSWHYHLLRCWNVYLLQK